MRAVPNVPGGEHVQRRRRVRLAPAVVGASHVHGARRRPCSSKVSTKRRFTYVKLGACRARRASTAGGRRSGPCRPSTRGRDSRADRARDAAACRRRGAASRGSPSRSARRACVRSGRGSSPRSRRRRARGMMPGLIGKKQLEVLAGTADADPLDDGVVVRLHGRRRLRPMSRSSSSDEREDAGAPAARRGRRARGSWTPRSRRSRPAAARGASAHDVLARRRELRADADVAERDASRTRPR